MQAGQTSTTATPSERGTFTGNGPCPVSFELARGRRADLRRDRLSETGQLPPHRIWFVGVVALSDLVDALVHGVRLASVVVFVSDLTRSLASYAPLLRYRLTASEVGNALLTGSDGSELYLHQATDSSARRSEDYGFRYVAWTARDPDELDRCTRMLTDREAYVGRGTSDGIDTLEGRDPDGLPVLISYPGPDTTPRHHLSFDTFWR
jgi:hypothetical protein